MLAKLIQEYGSPRNIPTKFLPRNFDDYHFFRNKELPRPGDFVLLGRFRNNGFSMPNHLTFFTVSGIYLGYDMKDRRPTHDEDRHDLLLWIVTNEGPQWFNAMPSFEFCVVNSPKDVRKFRAELDRKNKKK